jgi:hypothetical protein
MTKPNEARSSALDNAADASMTWRYTAPAGHSLQDCLRPDYWQNSVRELGMQRVLGRHAFNRIEILAEDGTWEAELRVMSIDKGLVTTRLLRKWFAEKSASSDAPELSAPAGYKVEHITGNGWRALDPKGQILIEKQTERGKALLVAVEHSAKAKGGK